MRLEPAIVVRVREDKYNRSRIGRACKRESAYNRVRVAWREHTAVSGDTVPADTDWTTACPEAQYLAGPMSGLLQLIQHVDVSIFHFLNGFAGNRVLDYVCKFGEHSKLSRGGVLFAVYWFFWFQPDARLQRRRRVILTVLAGALLSVLACRLIADLLPFRTRPVYDLSLPHQPYAVPVEPDLVNWSAFPSDNATFFFALAFGMFYLVRWAGIFAMLYAALWICLPRMFLGVHYTSDTVVGAAIGIAIVWASMRARWLQSNVAAPLLAFADARPAAFYAAAFLCSVEMAALFEDVRAAGGTALRIFEIDPRYWLSLAVIAGASALVFLALVWAVFILAKKGYGGRLHWWVGVSKLAAMTSTRDNSSASVRDLKTSPR